MLPDARQSVAVQAFERLFQELNSSRPSRWWSFPRLAKRHAAPHGIYIYGSVGRGKTHLMDLFYDSVAGQRKQRWHYHDFMRWLHEQLRQHDGQQDPMAGVVKKLGKNIDLLCLDEFLVNDIADAMLLAGLLRHLQANGITLVTTSNVRPDDLYQDGLQRARFLPAIQWLNQNMQVIHLDGETDFRYRQPTENSGTAHETSEAAPLQKWFFPSDDNARHCLRNWFEKLGGKIPDTMPEERPPPVRLNGHWLPIRAQQDAVIWTAFTALCAENRHSDDYLELASRYRALILEDVPVMTDETNDAARRFITLVDVLYDRGTGLVASAEEHFSQLYTGQRLGFEFKRTVSRLNEMQSLPLAAHPAPAQQPESSSSKNTPADSRR